MLETRKCMNGLNDGRKNPKKFYQKVNAGKQWFEKEKLKT